MLIQLFSIIIYFLFILIELFFQYYSNYYNVNLFINYSKKLFTNEKLCFERKDILYPLQWRFCKNLEKFSLILNPSYKGFSLFVIFIIFQIIVENSQKILYFVFCYNYFNVKAYSWKMLLLLFFSHNIYFHMLFIYNF